MGRKRINPIVYAALYLRKRSASEKVSFANRIITAMTGSVVFSSPDPSLPEMQDATDALRDATAAYTGSTADRFDLQQKEDQFDLLITRLKEYAETTANADPAIAAELLSSAGFDIAKRREPSPVPDAVREVMALFTNIPGTIDVKWNGVKCARVYQVFLSTTGEMTGTWTIAATTASKKATITGLESGKRYYFMVKAIGTKGYSMPGTVATSIAA